jgi:hypothetical protein
LVVDGISWKLTKYIIDLVYGRTSEKQNFKLRIALNSPQELEKHQNHRLEKLRFVGGLVVE